MRTPRGHAYILITQTQSEPLALFIHDMLRKVGAEMLFFPGTHT